MHLEVDMVTAEGERAFVRSDAEVRLRARQGLAIYFGMVVLLSAVFQVLFIQTRTLIWVVPLMWSPAVASMVARLALREGLADVSFGVGGRRGWQAIAVAAIFPIAIGLPVYGIAWKAGLADFAPRPRGVAAHLASTSPVASFVIMLAMAATIGTIMASLTAAGEEIGWRGYMLTRLIDAGVPRPVLMSGVIWGLWHVPLILGGVYLAGPPPIVSALLWMVVAISVSFVFARLRLATGSIWPAIALHAAWNSIIQVAFDPASTGPGATLWVGESGILVMLTVVVAAIVVTRGRWTVRRFPEVSRDDLASAVAPQV
jgi:membrane protease YdiL (CAAX protease family)